jgi:hypothetical protein
VPPDAEPVKETDCTASGEEGVNVKLVDKGIMTLIDCCEVAACWDGPLSLTVRVTVKVPVVE